MSKKKDKKGTAEKTLVEKRIDHYVNKNARIDYIKETNRYKLTIDGEFCMSDVSSDAARRTANKKLQLEDINWAEAKD